MGVIDGQLYLPFDDCDLARITESKKIKMQKKGKGKKKNRRPLPLPHFPNPKNDNEELLELQYKFKQGDKNALALLYQKSSVLCFKFVNKQTRKNKRIKRLSNDERQEKAHDSASYLIQRLLKDSDFAVYKSFTAYLYLRVLHELYYQSEADKIVDFVDLQTFFKDELGAFEEE